MSATEIRSLNGYKLTDEIARGNIEKLRTESQQYTNTKISQLINSAPTTLDTLGEIAAAMAENATVVEALDAAIGQKAGKDYVDEAIANLPKGEPDWDAKEGEEGYIKNKPFDYGPDYFKYEYNGNLEDYEYVEENDTIFIKVGEALSEDTIKTLSEKNPIQTEVTYLNNNKITTLPVIIYQLGTLAVYVGTYSIMPTPFILNVMEETLLSEITDSDKFQKTLPKGLYFYSEKVRSFTNKDIKKINQMFLPDSGDWTEDNKDNYSYIKNRTHYEKYKTYTFDGNYESYEHIEVEEGAFYVKISEDVLTLKDFNGLRATLIQVGAETDIYTSNADVIDEETGMIAVNPGIIIAPAEATLQNFVFTPGIWIIYQKTKNYSTYISKIKFIIGIEQLDEKFIPDSIARASDLDNYLLKTETAENANMLGGKAPEYYIQPRNLLDNSDFRNPVNQRGLFSASNYGYTIDRWIAAYQESVSITPVDGGLQITGKLIQRIPAEYFKDATPYTVAVYYTDGTHESAWGTHTYDMLGEWYDVATNDDLKIQLSVRGTSEYLEATINTNKAIAGVAVYEGRYTNETLPPYVPKGYAVELNECQRYFERIGIRQGGSQASILLAVNTTGDFRVLQGYKVPKRIQSPTIMLMGKNVGEEVSVRHTLDGTVCTGVLSLWNNNCPDRLNTLKINGTTISGAVYEGYLDIIADL